MKITEALIAWNLNSSEVEVGPWPDRNGWSRQYQMTTGACYVNRHEVSPSQQLLYMLMDFHVIVVRYKVDPDAAHKAFMAIDEYQQLVSSD